jgi:putative transposase
MAQYKTYKFRIKDSNKALVKAVRQKAAGVNWIWNFCRETQEFAFKHNKKWPSLFELQRLTAGCTKELGLQSSTIQSVCEEYDTRRKQFKKPKLRWRSNKKSLVWIPFKESAVKVNHEDGSFRYYGLDMSFWRTRNVKGTTSPRPVLGDLVSGSITSDARGRLYINLVHKLPDFEGTPSGTPVGVDPGLEEVAVLSTGVIYRSHRYTRHYQNKLAKAQRAGKKKQARNIHAKISNSRKDQNHKISTEIVNTHSHIYMGNLSPTWLIESGKAKSTYDVGLHQLKSFLRYKALARGVSYREVSEINSTRICSECFCIPDSSPKGDAQLSVREWICSECGTKHHRDVNAARNILRFGHESPPETKRPKSKNRLAPTGIPRL